MKPKKLWNTYMGDKPNEIKRSSFEKRKLLSDHGLTLIEIIISIAILGILIVPLFHNFVVTANLNADTKNVQQQTVLLQNLMEQMKLQPMAEIAREFNYPVIADGSIKAEVKPKVGGGYEEVQVSEQSSLRTLQPTGGYEYQLVERMDRPYYFAQKNIEYGGNSYDAVFVLDGTGYIYDSGGSMTGYNTYQMPLPKDVNHSTNVVATQTYETELALATLYNNHISYCIKREEEHALDPSFHIDYHTMEEIEATLKKQIRIDIHQSGSDILVHVSQLYSSGFHDGTGYEGCGTVSYDLVNQRLGEKGSIYVFYYPSYWDEIRIIKEDTITEVIDVYLYRQEDGTSTNVKKELTILPSPIAINFFSNVEELTMNQIKKDQARNRIFDVKIQLYKAGFEFHPEALCAELVATKEE